MSYAFKVKAEDIECLNAEQLTELLRALLYDEVDYYDIQECEIHVSPKIYMRDGGEDGRIRWSGKPASTKFLPSRFVVFQAKATEMTPKECVNELKEVKKATGKEKNVNKWLEDRFSEGAAYILFTTHILNPRMIQNRIDKMKGHLREHGSAHAKGAQVYVYDAEKIQNWINSQGSSGTIQMVLDWVNRPFIPGSMLFKTWQERYDLKFSFVENDLRRKIIQDFCNNLQEPKKALRIIGPPGIGKTRLAFEICTKLDDMGHSIIYCDMKYTNHDGFLNKARDLILYGTKVLLVIDNCDLDTHKELSNTIKSSDSNSSLLSIHYDIETSVDPYVKLTPMDIDDIKSMLSTVYGNDIAYLDRLAEYTSGFPMMAELLADTQLDMLEEDAGVLNDQDLMQKLLWGDDPRVEDDERMLRACALFERFGYKDGLENELEFIAEHVVLGGVKPDLLYECIKRFERRGIVNLIGRYAQIIPKPLAIQLAAEWWEYATLDKQTELVNKDMPGRLGVSYNNQITDLDNFSSVKKFVIRLIDRQGSFEKKEMILSVKGSSLFHSLVEIEPVATSDALYRTFKSITNKEILSISGEVRRNLITSLEKLCFRGVTFVKSAKILLRFAANENEVFSNNATGIFTQLFRTAVSGTEAKPSSRFEVIDMAMASENDQERMVAIEALYAAIDYRGGMRMVGPEYQGGGLQELKEWRPSIQEALDYWVSALERLTMAAMENNPESQHAKEFIGSSIRSLVPYGEVMVNALDHAIRQITNKDDSLWLKAIEEIKDCLLYDKNQLPDETTEMLHNWEDILEPDTLEEQLKRYVCSPPWEYREDDNSGELIDVSLSEAENFAALVSNRVDELIPQLPILLTGEQRQAGTFAKTLAKTSQNWLDLLDPSIKFIKDNPGANIQFLAGLLVELYSKDINHWRNIITLFSREDTLVPFYPIVVTTGKVEAHHLKTIIALVRSKNLEPEIISNTLLSRYLDNMNIEDVHDFAVRLSEFSNVAKWVSLDFMRMYCHEQNDRFLSSVGTFKHILTTLSLSLERPSHAVRYEMCWKSVAHRLLGLNDRQFAKDMVRLIISSTSSKIDYSFLRNCIRPIMQQIFEQHAAYIWDIVGNEIINTNPDDQFILIDLIGHNRYSFDDDGEVFPLDKLPSDILDQWLENNPEAGSVFIAKASNMYIFDAESPRLSPRVSSLLNSCPNIDEVLPILSNNANSFSWTNSPVPRYRNEVIALKPLLHHAKIEVREWAEDRIHELERAIEYEKTRGEEEGRNS